MIITLTPNPSLDRTIAVDKLARGEVHRATASRVEPGGKGINVARALTAHGYQTLAVYPSGGPEGHLMGELLELARVAAAPCPVMGSLRSNVTVVEPDGTTTKLNEPGPALSPEEHHALLRAVDDRATVGTTWFVGSGSLPPGLPAEAYRGLVELGARRGVRVALDTSGAPLARSVSASPHLVKPNRIELAELLGRRLGTLGDVLEGAREVVAGGVETVVVSLGRHGAVAVTAGHAAHAIARVDRPRSTVGAGDALLAGFLHAQVHGADLAGCLTAGVGWGAAAVSLPGSRMPAPGDVARIPVTTTTDLRLDLLTND